MIDQVVGFAHAILDRIEPFAGLVRPRAMGEVAAGLEAHAEYRVTGLDEAHEDGLVGLAAGMRLDIGVGGTVKRPGALHGQFLDHIDMFAAAIIAPSGIPLSIFVCQHGALGFQHRAGGDVLRGDQLDLLLLARFLGLDCGSHVRIGPGDRFAEKATAWACGEGSRVGHGHLPWFVLAQDLRLHPARRKS